ncbi:adenylosuccinate synthase [Desulfurobacterium indicum]|uniref:Adenylosuccinate synthetase n=1 Tax=Desulfurobacterium indicum TaxID=1914305 RepID=A0A1R1ML51_9BACT|nr:adenylosuccinate synthase [Desulfurobacterium indicum]OMH40424.1 adenylosuccinate synthase [Desulfurobacterium indicum]
MATLGIVGTQWGDEGKGKIVDILSDKADIIARFQGGNNAGHTVVISGNKYVLHLLPSGILHDEKICVLGNGMVIDLEALINEVEFIKRVGKPVDGRILLSERAHIILPYHKQLDAASEMKKGNGSIGTTLKGIGPAYRDKAGRMGIRIADLKNPETFKRRLVENIKEKSIILKYVYGYEPDLNADEIYTSTMRAFEKLEPFVADTISFLNRAIDEGKNVLFEGAQATLLDIDAGTYPFVTSSNSSALGIASGTGISPKKVQKIAGIAKAYTTRVGSGPFPTELGCQLGELLRARGHEYGSTTGRPRRCGWLDLVAVKYSTIVNDLDSLVITKLDVLDAFEEIKICVGYKLDGKTISNFPSTVEELELVEPIYKTLPGWHTETTQIQEFDKLPENAKKFINFIEEYVGIPVSFVSTGPQRSEIICRTPLW